MIKRFMDHGNGGDIYEKRIYDRDILQRTCFGAKVDVPEEIVGLEKLPPKKRRDAKQQGRIVPNRSAPMEVHIEIPVIGDMAGDTVVDATIRTKTTIESLFDAADSMTSEKRGSSVSSASKKVKKGVSICCRVAARVAETPPWARCKTWAKGWFATKVSAMAGELSVEPSSAKRTRTGTVCKQRES